MSALPIFHHEMTQEDAERENFIVAAGRRFLAAHAAGDMEGARIWLAAEAKEVLSRRPHVVAQLEQERGLV
jgi:hypothetical protein